MHTYFVQQFPQESGVDDTDRIDFVLYCLIWIFGSSICLFCRLQNNPEALMCIAFIPKSTWETFHRHIGLQQFC